MTPQAELDAKRCWLDSLRPGDRVWVVDENGRHTDIVDRLTDTMVVMRSRAMGGGPRKFRRHTGRRVPTNVGGWLEPKAEYDADRKPLENAIREVDLSTVPLRRLRIAAFALGLVGCNAGALEIELTADDSLADFIVDPDPDTRALLDGAGDVWGIRLEPVERAAVKLELVDVLPAEYRGIRIRGRHHDGGQCDSDIRADRDYGTIAHEIGHAMGLEHVSDRNIMRLGHAWDDTTRDQRDQVWRQAKLKNACPMTRESSHPTESSSAKTRTR